MTNKVKALQATQLNILISVLEVFKKHHLDYIAVGGTVLGAYRHKGFIPWDDDIDIAMPRADYDKFLGLQNELPDTLFIQHFMTEQNYPLCFAKVRLDGTRFVERRFKAYDIHHGVFIDIFPLDNINNNIDVPHTKKQLRKYSNNFRRSLKPYKHWFYRLLSPFTSPLHHFEKYENYSTKENQQTTDKIGFVLTNDYFSVQSNWSEHQLPFEHIMINVPKNVEGYLTGKYGDYMKIPEEKDRRTHDIIELDI